MTEQSIKISLPDERATYQLGEALGRSLPAGSTLLLYGDLGSGKTTLVKGLGRGLGIRDTIISPTFTLINEYLDGRLPLYHLDLYRLDPSETAGLALETYWEGLDMPPGIVAIEWADQLLTLPNQYLHIVLSTTDGSDRTAQIKMIGHPLLDWSRFSTALEPLS